MTSGREAQLKEELARYDALENPTLEQDVRANDVARELHFTEQERQRQAAELAEQERGRKQTERDRVEAADAFNRQRRERAERERLLAEAAELRRRADELEALYNEGGSWADAPPRPGDAADRANAAAREAALPRRRPGLAEGLQKVGTLAAEAGLDLAELSHGETAGLLVDAGVGKDAVRKWTLGNMLRR
jgi:hypothetical protein